MVYSMQRGSFLSLAARRVPPSATALRYPPLHSGCATRVTWRPHRWDAEIKGGHLFSKKEMREVSGKKGAPQVEVTVPAIFEDRVRMRQLRMGGQIGFTLR